jgi:hypothetical protein
MGLCGFGMPCVGGARQRRTTVVITNGRARQLWRPIAAIAVHG